MDTQIPIKGVVLFIAFGTLAFIIIFCFVKRQIMRFTLKSSRGPHELIGNGAPKALQLEIERRLKRAKEIIMEPQLIHPDIKSKLKLRTQDDPGFYYYRMKTLMAANELCNELSKSNNFKRLANMPLKVYLLELRHNGILEGIKMDVIDRLCSLYQHARHDPTKFTIEHYEKAIDLIRVIISHGYHYEEQLNEPKKSNDISEERRSTESSQKPFYRFLRDSKNRLVSSEDSRVASFSEETKNNSNNRKAFSSCDYKNKSFNDIELLEGVNNLEQLIDGFCKKDYSQ